MCAESGAIARQILVRCRRHMDRPTVSQLHIRRNMQLHDSDDMATLPMAETTWSNLCKLAQCTAAVTQNKSLQNRILHTLAHFLLLLTQSVRSRLSQGPARMAQRSVDTEAVLVHKL